MVIDKRYIFILITIIGVLISNISLAQFTQRSFSRGSKSNELAIRVESGGSVSFSINSMTKYNEGVKYNEWTRIGILVDLNAADHEDKDHWKLEFKANTENIIGDSGNELDLDYIYLVAKNDGATDLGFYIQEEKPLESGYQTLVEDVDLSGGFDDFKILITYKCGRDPKEQDKILLGEPPGYYYVDIEFKVEVY